MTKLKVEESEKSAVSHEAKLGVMVITILTFAFGFLVYHKMDLHQRKLTEASIASTAPDATSQQPLDADTQLAAQSELSAATDPLMTRSELSDGSPFADTEKLTADGTDSSTSTAAEFGGMTATTTSNVDDANAPVMTLNEPQDSIPTFSSIQSGDAESKPVPGSDTTDFPAAIDVSAESPFDVTAADVVAAATDSASLDAESFPATTLEVGRDAFANETEQAMDQNASVADGSADFVPMPVDLQKRGTADAATSSETELESSHAGDTSRSFSASELSANAIAASAKDEEPVLLAMAEPQREHPVFGSFTADDGGVTSGNTPTSKPDDSFPATDAPESKSLTRQDASLAQQSSPFGSRGFDAVRKPNGRSGRTPIRTAAGSGADGKFSLAAFNYNNNGAQPAPDDGSTFDSVVVQNGDNYTKISRRVYGTIHYFAALAVFNQHRIAEPKNMRPGMVVLTPPKELLEERYPQLFEDSKPREIEPAGFLLLEDGSPAYRVGERETLSDVSKRYLGRSSRWTEIYRLNQSNIPDPNKLKTGLILALPADAAEVNVTP